MNIETFSLMPEVKTSATEDGRKASVITIGNDDDMSKIDYINKINTELMSGGGADLLAMDVLPYYKYAEKGQLEDLKKYMEEDQEFIPSNYLQNIVDAVQYKGRQYLFPISYSFQYLSYDTTLLDKKAQDQLAQKDTFTYEELTEIAYNSFQNQKKQENTSKMYNIYDCEKMFQVLLKEHYNKILNFKERTANFTDGTFRKILETAKEYGENGYVIESVVNLEKGSNKNTEVSIVVGKMGTGQNGLPRYFYQAIDQGMLVYEFKDLKSGKISIDLSSILGNTGDNKIAGLLSNEQGEIPFDLRMGFGMNSNSQNKKTAWEFIKFLASEEMQTSMKLIGCPIHKKAMEERAKLEITGQLFAPEENLGIEKLTEAQKKIFQEYFSVLNRFVNQLNTYLMQDSMINEMIEQEIPYFFDGTKTAEEVAETLQSQIELYLNE